MRYEIIKLKKAKKGFRAVVVDNQHPSGLTGIPIQWFDVCESAEKHLKKFGHKYKITEEV